MNPLTSAIADIHSAYVAALTSDPALMAIIKGVYDEIPADSQFPYIMIGDDIELPADTFGRRGRDITVTLRIWSQYPGFKEAEAIAAQVIRILDRNTFPLPSGWQMAFNLYLGTPIMLRYPDDSQDSRQVAVRFTTRIEE